MVWWETLDPDVQKYAAGGVVTGGIALLGTLVTFFLSGLRDAKRENVRREADRAAEDERRKADREAEDDRWRRELADRQDERSHARSEELRRRGLEGAQKALDAALELRDRLTTVAEGVDPWTPDARKLLRAVQASALTIDRKDVRHGLYNGVDAVDAVTRRARTDADQDALAAQTTLVGHIRDLAGAYLRGHEESVANHARHLSEAKARETL